MNSIIKRGIQGIVPIYGANGENGIYIYLNDGEAIYMDKSIRAFLAFLFHQRRIDLYALRQWTSSLLHRRNGLPLVFSRELVLVPVKVRKPIGRADGSEGYISLLHIEDICEKDDQTMLRLQCGKEIISLHSRKIVERRIVLAQFILTMYEKEAFEWEGFSYIYQNTMYPPKKIRLF
ncbi:hypothetical protein [Defluviitalea saccharophila]|uniref:Uncharacterized protein n=1 Tax=Defluviitalea saccharophila TaxID=879970 RepID=A0ABZ2Y1V7_9FIRM|nr:hypothetical protein [Candidatus Epulonipiscium sp.]